MYFKINFPIGYQVDNHSNDNIDINVILKNNDVFAFTLFTLKNISFLMSRDSSNYFWAADMIIVKDLKLDTIKLAIKELLLDGYLENYFSKLGDVQSIFGNPPSYGELIIVE